MHFLKLIKSGIRCFIRTFFGDILMISFVTLLPNIKYLGAKIVSEVFLDLGRNLSYMKRTSYDLICEPTSFDKKL